MSRFLTSGILTQGAKLNIPILFEVEEGTTEVGQIPEISETYTILQDEGVFTVDEAGLIEFIVAPDYEVKNEYYLKVRTDKHTYSVSVNVTDVASEFELLIGTVLNLNTAI